MRLIDPLFLRSVINSLQSGQIDGNDVGSVPEGLATFYEMDLFAKTMRLTDRHRTLGFFLAFAIARRPISTTFSQRLLDIDGSRDEVGPFDPLAWSESQVREAVMIRSRYFSSTADGRYALYHERFGAFIFQKATSSMIFDFNERFIETCLSGLDGRYGDEVEGYALEHLSHHLHMAALLSSGKDDRLYDWVYDRSVWETQKAVEGALKWVSGGFQKALSLSVSRGLEPVIRFGKEYLSFIGSLQSEAGRFFNLASTGFAEKALENLNLLQEADDKGMERRMNVCLILILIVASSDIDETSKKANFDILLNYYAENVPKPCDGFPLWSDSIVPAAMLFMASVQMERLGCDWRRIWSNHMFPQMDFEFRHSHDTAWVVEKELIKDDATQLVMAWILQPRRLDLEYHGVLKCKCHLTLEVAENLLSSGRGYGLQLLRDMIKSNVMSGVEFRDFFDSVKAASFVSFLRHGSLKSALILYDSISGEKAMEKIHTDILGALSGERVDFVEGLLGSLDGRRYSRLRDLLESMRHFSLHEYEDGFQAMESFLGSRLQGSLSRDHIGYTCLSSLIRGTDDIGLLLALYGRLFKGSSLVPMDECLGISFDLAFAFRRLGDSDMMKSMLTELVGIDDLRMDTLELFEAVKCHWRDLEAEFPDYARRLAAMCMQYAVESPYFLDFGTLLSSVSGTFAWRECMEFAKRNPDVHLELERVSKDYFALSGMSEEEIALLEEQLQFHYRSRPLHEKEFLLSEVIPHFSRILAQGVVEEKISRLRLAESRSYAYGRMMQSRLGETDINVLTMSLLSKSMENPLGTTQRRSCVFLSTAVLALGTGFEGLCGVLVEKLEDGYIKDREITSHSIHYAYTHDVQGFRQHVGKVSGHMQKLLLYAAFIEYHEQISRWIEEDRAETSDGGNRLTQISGWGIGWVSHMPTWFRNGIKDELPAWVTNEKAAYTDITNELREELVGLMSSAAGSEWLDGLILNLLLFSPSITPSIDNLTEMISGDPIRILSKLLIALNESPLDFSDERISHLEELLENLLGLHDDYLKTRLFIVLLEHISVRSTYGMLVGRLSIRSKLHMFGLYAQYAGNCLHAIGRDFKAAEISIMETSDPGLAESSRLILAVEAFKSRDFGLVSRVLSSIRRIEYLEDTARTIAEGFFKQLNYVSIFKVPMTGVLDYTGQIGRLRYGGAQTIAILESIDVPGSIVTRHVGWNLNVWNFDEDVAKYAIFKSHSDARCLNGVLEAYSHRMLLDKGGDFIASLAGDRPSN